MADNRELESQLEREQKSVNELSLANQELHERIAELEAEASGYSRNAVKRIAELEAERDELKFKYKHWRARYEGQYKMTQELRARHAALVEKVQPIYEMVFSILQGKADMSKIQDIERGLKAALAEVEK